MSQRVKRRVLLLALSVAGSAAAAAQAVDPSCHGPVIKPGVVCPGEQTNPAGVINEPSTYAWAVFTEINQPAFPGNARDTRRVWETWKSADDNSNPNDALYLNNGSAPQPWNVTPNPGPLAKALAPIRQLELLQEQFKQVPGAVTPFFIPSNPLSEEVRTNRPAFNFILANTLYNQQGQYAYASVKQSFDFPVSSKEVKAIWQEATAGIDVSQYYHAQAAGRTYILVSMHLITKDLPFWFWTSFVHKDQNKDPQSGYVAPLLPSQPIPESLRGTPFANYRLIAELAQGVNGKLVPDGAGSQVDWINRIGEPTVLGNPNIETGFEQQSSCITCHAHASIGRSSTGQLSYNAFPLAVGALNPNDMMTNGVTFYPLDFLWSLRNAKSAQAR
jgi:hypothetical protein